MPESHPLTPTGPKWEHALQVARRALARHQSRVGLLHDPDTVLAVLAWTHWSLPGAGDSGSLVSIVHTSTPPAQLPPGDVYTLQLLKPLQQEIPDRIAKTVMDARMDDFYTEGMDVQQGPPEPGQPRDQVDIAVKISFDDVLVQCPVCGRTQITLLWDLVRVTAYCSEDHTWWTPNPTAGLELWEQIKDAATTPPPA